MASERLRTSAFASLALAFGASLAAALLLLFLFSDDFFKALRLFFLSPFGNVYYFGNMVAASVPLMLGGLGIAFAFSARTFNLGGEGQIYSGALAATAICLVLPGLSGSGADAGSGLVTGTGTGVDSGAVISGLGALGVQIVALCAGALTGGVIGGFSGSLKRRLGVDELISSFLVSAVVVLVVDFLITGPMQDPSSNFQTTIAILPVLRFARLLPPSSLSTGFLLALAVCILAAFIIARTRFGYELKVVGHGGEFARYAGINTGLYQVAPMAISGALHGLAGAAMILGSYYKSMRGFSSGVGWSGIAVALIAGNRALAVIPAALFFAWLDAGAKSVMVGSSVTSEIVAVVQAVIFFFVTAKVGFRGRRGRKALPGRAGKKVEVGK